MFDDVCLSTFGTIIYGYLEAIALHVQSEVLAHDSKTDEANVRFSSH